MPTLRGGRTTGSPEVTTKPEKTGDNGRGRAAASNQLVAPERRPPGRPPRAAAATSPAPDSRKAPGSSVSPVKGGVGRNTRVAASNVVSGGQKELVSPLPTKADGSTSYVTSSGLPPKATPKATPSSYAASVSKAGTVAATSGSRKMTKNTPPLTPQSEFKLLSDDLSPSFGGAASSQRLGAAGGIAAQAPVPFSPLVPASSLAHHVPSSREWYTSSSSEGSNEWSNGIPEFSFSEAGSPMMAQGGSSSGGGASGVRAPTVGGGGTGAFALGIGYAIALGARAKRRPGGDQSDDIESPFGGLFSDGPGRGDDYGQAADESVGARRRKKRRGAADYGDGIDMKGSPQLLSVLHAVTPESDGVVGIRCNCKRSKCLKLYCDCLRVNKYCEGCNCSECNNTTNFAAVRNAAVASIIERNPDAFKARISEDPLSMSKEHLQGCHCKKSACLKKYCECFSATAACTERCRCIDCMNGGGSGGRSAKEDVDEQGTKKSARRRKITMGLSDF